jgi:hypothetical protein
LSIEDYAFNNQPITSIIFPDNGDITIGHYAFNAFSGTSIDLNDSVTVVKGRAFSDNKYDSPPTPLTTVTLGKNVREIGTAAFYHAPITTLNLKDNTELTMVGMTHLGLLLLRN